MPSLRLLAAVLWSGALFTVATLHGLLTLRRRLVIDTWAPIWGRSVLRLLRIELVIRGREHLLVGRSQVVVSNHTSTLDLPVFAALAPPGMLNLGKKELRRVPLFNLVWWATDGIFLDRADPKDAGAALVRVIAAMKARPRSVVLAPEGTRSRDGRLGRFKLGAWRLAAATGSPIVPCVVRGAAALMPPGAWVPRPGRIFLEVHPPIDVVGDDLRAQADALHARYVGWLEAPLSTRTGSPEGW